MKLERRFALPAIGRGNASGRITRRTCRFEMRGTGDFEMRGTGDVDHFHPGGQRVAIIADLKPAARRAESGPKPRNGGVNDGVVSVGPIRLQMPDVPESDPLCSSDGCRARTRAREACRQEGRGE